VLVAVSLLALSALASGPPASMIIPSRSIGPFSLGMTEGQVRVQRRTAPCDVMAVYTGGKTSRLETNCGGAYRTAEHIQVGEGPARLLAAFGTPEGRTRSDFAGVHGEWLIYRRAGIAFRIVYADDPGDALIQAIAVFQGSAPRPERRVPTPAPPPGPPPGVGE